MKNKYKIIDDYVIIYLKKRTGEIFETYIDLDDLERIDKSNLKYSVQWCKAIHGYYVQASEYLGTINGKAHYKTHYLHKDIMNVKNNEVVDHINHDTLDNKKSNLRVITIFQNTKHRKSKNTNNTSGYRNVSRVGNQWYVQLQIDGKNTCLKKFPLDKLDEAGIYAEIMRNKIYGTYAGNN